MVVRHLLSLVAASAAIVLLVGCAGASPSHGKSANDRHSATDYIIGPADRLQIHVRDNGDLSFEAPVRPDGRIAVPLIGDVEAAGLTPVALGNAVESRLAAYLRNPNVTIIVRDFVGMYANQIRIIGGGVQPQAVAYRDGMTVLDAIIQVGGVTKFAAPNRTQLLRQRYGRVLRFRVRLGDLIKRGDLGNNRTLRPGDILVVPEAYL